jgi:uncharacterized DUF497 family protein
MEFGWDRRKSISNIQKHGLAFEIAALLLRSPVMEEPDGRHDYGEQRVRAYGKINGRLLVCVYTDRRLSGRDVRWIISLRKANKREMRIFDAETKDG